MHSHLRAKHPAGPSTGQQQSVASFMIRSTKLDARPAEQTTALITKMIAKDMLPISFVEGEGFRNLMEFVDPEFTVPSRKTITARLEKLFDDNVRELRSQLTSVEKMAPTTDSWTALTTESYITVTCHYIVDWEIRSAVLQTKAMPERHTAKNLANMLSTAMDHWGLSGKITACVHDNASNMVLANTEWLEWDSQPCFAHTLQLATNDGFKVQHINHVVASVSRLVSHFHHSTTATQALKQKQQLQNLHEHKLVQYCRTRAFTKLSDARSLELTDDCWEVMEELLPVLHSLKCATTALCGESGVSISMVYPVTATLLSKHLKEIPGESPKVSQFKQTVSMSLERRLAPANVSSACKVAYIASFLDPRHKHLRFASEEVKRAVQAKVCDLISNSSESEEEIGLTESNETQPLAKKPRSDSPSASAIAVLFGEDYNVQISDTTELNQYCQDMCPPIHIDPMNWWTTNAHKYPRIAKLAKAYLCVPATSVPSERVFSAAGLIMNRLRSRLHSEHVDMLIFLNKNMRWVRLLL
ncbi:Zinc finger BED domain-containing protein 1 [Anabarilius grahami]|uniref:Zinc finger BED domain-containing protein 1 n=1 Tax=Anabarilius grahami TaxID=495550 RepID=A0A3N0YHS3_ANAGA|nr:Zinc finger BED domain-containing protein 1 [Anabarilius grahami]